MYGKHWVPNNFRKESVAVYQRKLPTGHIFWQDNDPKHTSNCTKAWMEANGVNHFPTPRKSPVNISFVNLANLSIVIE